MQKQKVAYALVLKMGFRTTWNNKAANVEFFVVQARAFTTVT